jgi:hypothetical protein
MNIFRNVRDILNLCRAILPVKKGLKSASRSMITYNDCIYICHHLSTIGYQFNKLADHQKSMSCYLDEIPLFYKLSQKILKNELNLQRDIILNLFCRRDIESNTIDAASHLEQIARIWRVYYFLL